MSHTTGNVVKSKYKVVFLGDIMTGKTTFITRYINGNFSANYSATIGIDFLSTTVLIKETKIRLQIWDTAGQERFRSLIPSYVREAGMVFVLYDITNRTSFENTDFWLDRVREERGDDCILILIGNKCDLEEQRTVSLEEGKAKSHVYGAVFGEACAKSGLNVETLFREACLALPIDFDTHTHEESSELLLRPVKVEDATLLNEESCCS